MALQVPLPIHEDERERNGIYDESESDLHHNGNPRKQRIHLRAEGKGEENMKREREGCHYMESMELTNYGRRVGRCSIMRGVISLLDRSIH